MTPHSSTTDLGPVRRLFNLLAQERGEIGLVYLYAVLAGLLCLPFFALGRVLPDRFPFRLEREGVDVRTYRVIYQLTDEIEQLGGRTGFSGVRMTGHATPSLQYCA